MTAKAMVEPLNTKAVAEAFAVWWNADGRFLDPDTSDVPWFDKREALAEYAYLAAAQAAESRVQSLEEEVKRLRTALLMIAHTETENSFGGSQHMPAHWYRDQARAALKENGNG